MLVPATLYSQGIFRYCSYWSRTSGCRRLEPGLFLSSGDDKFAIFLETSCPYGGRAQHLEPTV
jgi:hypothetical protein